MRHRILPVIALTLLAMLAPVGAGEPVARAPYLVSLAEPPLLQSLAMSKAVAGAAGPRMRLQDAVGARLALEALRERLADLVPRASPLAGGECRQLARDAVALHLERRG